jgi:hypothetical protein
MDFLRFQQRLARYLHLCNRRKRFFRSAVHLSLTLRVPLVAFVNFHDKCSSDFGGMGPVGDENPKSKTQLFLWGRRNAFDYAPVRVINASWLGRKIAKKRGLPEPKPRRVCVKDRRRVRGQISRASLHRAKM